MKRYEVTAEDILQFLTQHEQSPHAPQSWFELGQDDTLETRIDTTNAVSKVEIDDPHFGLNEQIGYLQPDGTVAFYNEPMAIVEVFASLDAFEAFYLPYFVSHSDVCTIQAGANGEMYLKDGSLIIASAHKLGGGYKVVFDGHGMAWVETAEKALIKLEEYWQNL